VVKPDVKKANSGTWQAPQVPWTRNTFAVAVPVAAVAVIAGIVSFGHIETLALSVHQTLAAARMLPGSVDFLIVAGSAILLAGSALGWLGVVPGVAATLFANVESGLPHGPLSAVIASWPAVAFTLATLMLERWLKRQVTSASGAPVSLPPGTGSTGTPLPLPASGPRPGRAPRKPSVRAGQAAAPAGIDETALLAELLTSGKPLPSVRALSLATAGIPRSRQVERVLEQARARQNGGSSHD
jgi:uncharacterized protein DUF2637